MKIASVKTFLSFASITGFALAVTGCQELNKDLSSINQSLSKVSGVPVKNSNPTQSTQPKSITNAWHVSNTQALNWLHQNDLDWNDSDKLGKVDWFKFWSQQIHAGTSLAKKAHDYCMVNSWSTYKPGKNCEYFADAYTSTMAQTSMEWGDKMVKEAGN